jgi:hypothetical protein
MLARRFKRQLQLFPLALGLDFGAAFIMRVRTARPSFSTRHERRQA